jgi:hypothetical protein
MHTARTVSASLSRRLAILSLPTLPRLKPLAQPDRVPLSHPDLLLRQLQIVMEPEYTTIAAATTPDVSDRIQLQILLGEGFVLRLHLTLQTRMLLQNTITLFPELRNDLVRVRFEHIGIGTAWDAFGGQKLV